MLHLRLCLLTALLSFIFGVGSVVHARSEIRLVGPDIPQRYFVGSSFIFSGSDSLYVGDSLLVRGVHYTFESRRGAFDLSRIQCGPSDTLRIVFSTVPEWVKGLYGTPLPEITPGQLLGDPIPAAPRPGGRQAGKTDVSITGAKTFRFTTSSAGASNFSQSLDMSISGNLGSGLQLTGAISDRGYDPSYGTANSRLNELEKVNLRLSSEVFAAQVGDILYTEKGRYPAPAKRISGASIEVTPRNGYAEAVAARPKGRFETVRFFGRNNTQGPYQITQGGSAAPVVPGSESVWLNGIKLERGAGKDYTMDYPAGRITFDVNHPIDSRSRIEIDYEPLLTSYRGELFAGGGGVHFADSSVSFDIGWLREGDDKDEPLTGDLSDRQVQILDAIGDDVSSATQPGVLADSLGDYILLTDSLPDTVYQYAGEENGQYDISFSYVGPANGEYVYVGGSQYVYAGAGNGDYLPVISIPVPQRTDHYRSSVTLRSVLLSEFTAEVRQSQLDKNLFSNLDDDDNGAAFFRIFSAKDWKSGDADNRITVEARKKEARFQTRVRLYDADFDRTYFLPTGFRSSADETIYTLNGSIGAGRRLRFLPFFSGLDYRRELTSRTGGVGLAADIASTSQVSLDWRTVRTESEATGLEGLGEVDKYTINLEQSLGDGIELRTGYEFDSRTNDYSEERRGTRYHQGTVSLATRTERIDCELFLEDSLSQRWSQQLRRNRLSGASSRKLGDFSYSALITYQWLSETLFDENSLLSRTSLDYFSTEHKLSISTAYTISEETRNSRGISYLKVEQGEGDYILEDGEFVPEPGGDYLRVEEILSELSRVRRGEKSFHLAKTWSLAMLKLNSRVEEELLPEGKRELWWILPALSDSRQPYLFYSREYGVDLRLFPIIAGHAVNIDYREGREIRSVANVPRQRSDYTTSLTFKQAVGKAFFEEQFELFKNDRDAYFASGGSIEGFKVGAGYRRLVGTNEFTAGGHFRRADSDRGERSDVFATVFGSRTQLLGKGELRSSLELYRQLLSITALTPSFLLTGNRPGERGAVWSISIRYGIKGGMRINFSLSGRHSDDRSARITGRGEFVAGF